MQEQVKDTKHRRIGWIASISITLFILVLFYFLIAWKEPYPPNPSYGIELSFGTDDLGYGDLPSEPATNQDITPSPTSEVEEPQEEVIDDSELDTDQTIIESGVTEVADEHPPEEPVKEVKPNVLPDKEKETETSQNENQTVESENKGTKENTTGDQGREEGSIDGRALMGNQGTTDGANLDLAGWTWDSKPQPKDQSAESGKIVYRIKIDDYGYITGLDLVSSTVSPEVERIYRRSVERITFSQTTNTPAPPSSSGTITFLIKAR